MKLKYDKPLSNFAFKFNLRRYVMHHYDAAIAALSTSGLDISVGRCRLTVSKPELKARLVSALETKM